MTSKRGFDYSAALAHNRSDEFKRARKDGTLDEEIAEKAIARLEREIVIRKEFLNKVRELKELLNSGAADSYIGGHVHFTSTEQQMATRAILDMTDANSTLIPFIKLAWLEPRNDGTGKYSTERRNLSEFDFTTAKSTSYFIEVEFPPWKEQEEEDRKNFERYEKAQAEYREKQRVAATSENTENTLEPKEETDAPVPPKEELTKSEPPVDPPFV